MDYVRYLKAKRTVDDRSLNQQVLTELERYIGNFAERNDKSQKIRVLEVGAGIGAMCSRFRRRMSFAGYQAVEYILVDVKADVLVTAKNLLLSDVGDHFSHEEPPPACNVDSHRFANISASNSIHTSSSEVYGDAQSLSCITLDDSFVVSFEVGDAMQFVAANSSSFDLVVAAALLDIWDLNECLPPLLSALDRNGLGAFYFPINFDGVTDFFPPSELGNEFDSKVEQAFHRAMGYRQTASHRTMAAHTGRRLLPILFELGVHVLSVGSSAWNVYPQRGCRTYPADEAYFLHCIINFVESSVPNELSLHNDYDELYSFKRYIANRRQQIDHGHIFYTAHNIDVFGCNTNIETT